MLNIEKGMSMGYNCITVIFYDSYNNTFYDQYRYEIFDIFKMLTPNDIFLFRHNGGDNIFTHRYKRDTMVEILVDYDY